jgi:hypothetical protein
MQYRVDERNLKSEEVQELKREQAQERQAYSDGLTVEERIKALDKKFGKGKGAKKERAKLKARLAGNE